MKLQLSRYIILLILSLNLSYHYNIQISAQEPIKTPIIKSNTKPKNNKSTTKSSKTSIPEARTSARSLDLQTRHNGKYYYFSTYEWSTLTPDQKKLFKPEGVVMKVGTEAFVIALNNEKDKFDKYITWDEAMLIYGELLPTKAQGEIIIKYLKLLNEALESFVGRNAILTEWYWTRNEIDQSHAWCISIYSSNVGKYTKTNEQKIRRVAPLPSR